MSGTEYGRKSGSYSTATIGTWELVRQDIAGNYSVIRSHLYFYYGGGTKVNSSSSSFGTMGVTLYSGSYSFGPGTHHLGSTDFIVYHNNDGTFPATNIGFWATSYHMSGGEVWGTIGYRAVADIPRQANITGCNDFNSDQNPYMTFNNPGGFRINARLEFGGTNIQKNNIPNTGSYTFSLSDSERQLLYSKCPNSNKLTVRYVIATCIGGTSENYWSYIDKTMTVVNSNPTFHDFEFKDNNAKTIALTGNNQNIIKGYSTILVSIPTESKAIAINKATMSKYRASCGSSSVDIAYSDTSTAGVINNPQSGTIQTYAIDSRGNSTLVTKQANKYIDYTPLTKGNISIARDNGVSETVRLNFGGKIDLINFGVVTNSIKSAKYRYRVTDNSEWSIYQDLEVETTNGTFNFNGIIKGDTEELGFDIGNSYQIEVIVEDELSSASYTDTLGSGIPNVALHKQGVGIMGKYDEEVGGLLQVAGRDILKKDYAFVWSNGQIATTWLTNWTSVKINLELAIINGSRSGESSYFKWDSNNNRLVAKKNISHLLIFAKYNWYNSDLEGDVSGKIHINGEERGGFGYGNHHYANYCEITGMNLFVNIKKDDYIEMYITSGSVGTRKCFAGGLTSFLAIPMD